MQLFHDYMFLQVASRLGFMAFGDAESLEFRALRLDVAVQGLFGGRVDWV